MKQDRKAIWGWAMYDWANSAFSTTVIAGFFPIFFKQYWSLGADVNTSTAQLGIGSSIASLLVALLAPVLGAIADQGNAKKAFLIFFAYLGVLMTAALFLVQQGNWELAILVFIVGSIGFAGANVFYDALLTEITSEEKLDMVSSFGYALGYLGGGLLFLLNVVMTLQPELFGLSGPADAVRYSFLTVAIWWGLFTIFTIVWVPEQRIPLQKGENFIKVGFQKLAITFRKIRDFKMILLFLLAYWFYIDGVHTIIRMAVDYGVSLGFESTDLITALLLVQFVAFPAALGFGKLGEKWGVKQAIILGVSGYAVMTLWATIISTRFEFYGLAVVIGLVQGGVQALSRSFYARLIPQDQAAEYFGFYNMLGKFAAIIGPSLVGLSGLIARSLLMPDNPTKMQLEWVGQEAARWSIGSIVLLFIIGGILLYFVDEKQAKQEIRRE